MTDRSLYRNDKPVNGKLYRYFRFAGKSTRLPDDENSTEFALAYDGLIRAAKLEAAPLQLSEIDYALRDAGLIEHRERRGGTGWPISRILKSMCDQGLMKRISRGCYMPTERAVSEVWHALKHDAN